MNEQVKRVVALLLVRGDKFLLTQRAVDAKWAASMWHIPGGSVEDDEEVAEAAIREIREELGVIVSRGDLTFQGLVTYDTSGDHNIDTFYFSTHAWDGEPQIMEPDKCQAIQWVTKGQIPENTVAHAKSILSHLPAVTYVQVSDGELRYELPGGDQA